MCFIITDITEHLVRIRDNRRTLVRTHRRDLFDHLRDLHRILDDNLSCLCRPQIFEFFQHLIRGPKIQRRLIVRITKALSCHDNPSVNLVLRVQKMHITGCHNRFMELLPQLYNPAVDILNILHGIYRPDFLRGNHKLIVPDRLDFQIIIKPHQPGNLHIALPVQKRPVQFSRFTGTSQNQPFPVFFHKTFWYSGMPDDTD